MSPCRDFLTRYDNAPSSSSSSSSSCSSCSSFLHRGPVFFAVCLLFVIGAFCELYFLRALMEMELCFLFPLLAWYPHPPPAASFAQVLETREPGGPRPYAVSLVQDVAQVHGKLVVPHIPRVMNSLMRALSASGSSPQLHLTCAKVVAALACYTIDASTPVEEAEQILRLLSQPLTDAIAGKPSLHRTTKQNKMFKLLLLLQHFFQ